MTKVSKKLVLLLPLLCLILYPLPQPEVKLHSELLGNMYVLIQLYTLVSLMLFLC